MSNSKFAQEIKKSIFRLRNLSGEFLKSSTLHMLFQPLGWMILKHEITEMQFKTETKIEIFAYWCEKICRGT